MKSNKITMFGETFYVSYLPSFVAEDFVHVVVIDKDKHAILQADVPRVDVKDRIQDEIAQYREDKDALDN